MERFYRYNQLLLVSACLARDWVTRCRCPIMFLLWYSSHQAWLPYWPVRRLLSEVAPGVTVMIENVVQGITENEFYWFLCVKIIVFCIMPLLLNVIFLFVLLVPFNDGNKLSSFPLFLMDQMEHQQRVHFCSMCVWDWNSWSASKQAWTVSVYVQYCFVFFFLI